MSRSNEVKVGLFVAAATVLLLAAFALVGGYNLFREPKTIYTVRTRFAGGIDTGAPVRYAGIRVGQVEDVRIDPDDPGHVVISFNVDTGTPIRTDSEARVSSLGLLGENYIEIAPGTREASPLPPGSEIPLVESLEWTEIMNSFGLTTNEINDLLADASPRLRQVLDNVVRLTNEENQERVRHLLVQMDDMVTEVRPRARDVLDQIKLDGEKVEQFLADMRGTREKLDDLMDTWGALAKGDDAEVQKTLGKLRATLDRAEATMEDIRQVIAANRQHLDVALENLRVSSENLREFSDTIKRQPANLLRFQTRPDRKPGDPISRK